MTFASRMTKCARPYDAARGAEGAAVASGMATGVVDLFAGVAGCSPYLAGLMRKEADWITVHLDTPEDAMASILADVGDLGIDQLNDGLRQAKRRTALLLALCDVGGVWTLEHVTGHLTDFANACVDRCLKVLVAAEIDRGKLPGMDADDAKTAGGMVALAMGKMGAGELNYSSDIDLICLYDETRFDPDDYHEARAAFIRVTRKMTAIMTDVTSGGYVFRTDLRLRPDANATPVCLSMEAAERYYESVGRTWERAAYIKASPSGGDISAGQRFLDSLRPFVWRKHLDFAAIEDAHDMRLKIRDHKGLHGRLVLEGHNMKLGRGGIREIEFFTQTRQLIAGGRDSSLRARDTQTGLASLAAAEWIPQSAAHALYDHYTFHRTVEHRLQMINDAQTHHLPSDDDGFARLAAFMDRDVDDLRAELTERLEDVHDVIEGFFAPDAQTESHGKSDWGRETTERWAAYPALRSARANQIFDRLWPDISARLQAAPRPDEALIQFDRFLSGLPSGVQLFSLFEANPQLTQLIVDIASTAPALADYLSRNAGVLDSVIGGRFFADWPATDVLTAQLSAVLAETDDYEVRLNTARRWARERHFRAGVHHLRGLTDASTSGAQYAALAQAVVAGMWPVVCEEFARKHGPLPGDGASVVAMGSLGAGRLNATSDLDLIVIYDADGVDASDGRRPLATRTYYARLTQALVTALSAPMADGRMYEVDMRLRPSGRAGPVATSFESFVQYQQTEAWTWEHLALTRARAVAGNPRLGQRIEAFRQDLLEKDRSREVTLSDTADMRERLRSAKPGQGVWDVKAGAGRMMEIELLAQACALLSGTVAHDLAPQLESGVGIGILDAADVGALKGALGLFRSIQAAGRLLMAGVLDPDKIGEGGRQMVLRETGFDDMARLSVALTKAADDADRIIDRALS